MKQARRQRPVMVAGQPAVTRLLGAIHGKRWRDADESVPTAKQVSMVLHALADHTSLEAAFVYDRGELGQPGVETPFYPSTTSFGRWLHAVADDIDLELVPDSEGMAG